MKRARHGDEMQSKKRIFLTANDKKNPGSPVFHFGRVKKKLLSSTSKKSAQSQDFNAQVISQIILIP